MIRCVEQLERKQGCDDTCCLTRQGEKEQEKDMKDFYNIDKFFKYSEKFPRLKDGKCIKMNNV